MLHIVQIGVRWLLLFSFLILILLFMKVDVREVVGWSAKSMRTTSDVALLCRLSHKSRNVTHVTFVGLLL